MNKQTFEDLELALITVSDEYESPRVENIFNSDENQEVAETSCSCVTECGAQYNEN